MSDPRPYTSDRRLFNWVDLGIIAAIGFCGGGLGLSCLAVVDWVGSRNVNFTIEVINADTRQPIPHARVCQLDPESRRHHWQSTNAYGRIEFIEECPSSGR